MVYSTLINAQGGRPKLVSDLNVGDRFLINPLYPDSWTEVRKPAQETHDPGVVVIELVTLEGKILRKRWSPRAMVQGVIETHPQG